MSIGFLTHSGFIIPVNILRIKFGKKYDEFIKKLTLMHEQKVGRRIVRKYMKMYEEIIYNGVKCIRCPRTLVKVFQKTGILDNVEIVFSSLKKIDAIQHIDLFENQNIIVDYLCKNVYCPERILDGTATCILDLRAGLGKTFVAGGLIARLKLKTLYITPRIFLAIQAVKDLKSIFCSDATKPNLIIKRYEKIQKTKKIQETHDIMVIVIDSALRQPMQFFAEYSMIVLDEVHTYCTEQRKKIFSFSVPVVLGQSGTCCDRSDGFDPIAHKELAMDGIIHAEDIPGFSESSKKTLDINFNCTAEIINYLGPPEFTQGLKNDTTGTISVHKMYNQFINDPFRTQIIIDKLIELYDWSLIVDNVVLKHHIFVFAEEIDILKKIKDIFCKALEKRSRKDIINDIDIETENLEMFTGKTKIKDIPKIIANARVLFASFAYGGTGVSINKMTAEIFVTPRMAQMKQIIPRILRRGSDVRIPRIIIDIVDKKTALRRQIGARLLAMEFYEFCIVYKNTKYSEIKIELLDSKSHVS